MLTSFKTEAKKLNKQKLIPTKCCVWFPFKMSKNLIHLFDDSVGTYQSSAIFVVMFIFRDACMAKSTTQQCEGERTLTCTKESALWHVRMKYNYSKLLLSFAVYSRFAYGHKNQPYNSGAKPLNPPCFLPKSILQKNEMFT